MISAIKAIEKAGYTALETSSSQLHPYRKGAAHLIVYRNGHSDQAAMIEVKRFGSHERGILEPTIKGALDSGEKFASGEWK